MIAFQAVIQSSGFHYEKIRAVVTFTDKYIVRKFITLTIYYHLVVYRSNVKIIFHLVKLKIKTFN